MATVYKAVHKSLPGLVRAIKVMHPSMGMDEALKVRFINEASVMAALDHPGIIKIFDYLEQNNNLFLVMEFAEGITLDDMIKNKTGPIPEERASVMFCRVLDAIGYAHSKGIVHRDIKPSNIIIAPGDQPKVIDFGIVKILEDDNNPGKTKTGTKIGTPLYMSPEQILARGVDGRSDIYGLGVTLFQMITGQSPYDSALSEFEIQTKIVNEPLPRIRDVYPPASNQMQGLIDKATAKKKEDRFQSCAEFHDAVLNKKNITPPPLPVNSYGTAALDKTPIISFYADNEKIKKGTQVTLTWAVEGGGKIWLSNDKGASKEVENTGSMTVVQRLTTTYVLTAGKYRKETVVRIKNIANAGVIIGGILFVVGMFSIPSFDGVALSFAVLFGLPTVLIGLFNRRYLNIITLLLGIATTIFGAVAIAATMETSYGSDGQPAALLILVSGLCSIIGSIVGLARK